MKTSIIALAAALMQQDDASGAAGGSPHLVSEAEAAAHNATEPQYARVADGSARPSTPEEASELAALEQASVAEAEGSVTLPGMEKPLVDHTLTELLELQHEMVATAIDLGLAGTGIVNRKAWHNKADAVRTVVALHARVQAARAERPAAPAPASPGLRRLRANKGAEELRNSTLAEGNAALAQAAAERQSHESGTGAGAQTMESTATSETPKRKRKASANGTAATPKTRKAEARAARAARGTTTKATKSTARKAVATKAPKAAGGARKGAVDYDNMKITVKHSGDNPKRGTAAERFKLYKDGMKCATYIDKVGDRGLAIADMRWDQSKGWIKLVPLGS